MAFKPNYNQQRAERNRLKQAKKDAKLREKENTQEHRKPAPIMSAPSFETPGDKPLTEQSTLRRRGSKCHSGRGSHSLYLKSRPMQQCASWSTRRRGRQATRSRCTGQ